ncbi:methyltransferase [Paucilactobacillus hokkaidonensis JCM 18461]|uniref:Methyltransferase n=2 Tax=Paucilactobacillus hokkaidonensis TaxID=1193095 RepID=A0A0A1GZ57_9LACO|nr:tRNA1(Val) (adenine(37)-N6)-methyltransferase [Paucilactobacillus hokkaidonensis]KRO10296.1 hypothetical protein IV59_GL001912 [Paucilactobacillus hokkaidonensis]BAP85751.1 methyltransferase [Paucilactobacillus hokkaidonensis JCM 18461]
MDKQDSLFLKDGERIDQLYSQDVKIIQSPEVFSFSLDAVLLADFVLPSKKSGYQIIDLCAGNGAISLFLHSKLAGHITQVELQPRLADMATRSVLLNKLQDRYSVLNLDIANIFTKIRKDSADIVICNPPYFTDLPTSKKNPNQYLAIARHELTTNLESVLATMSGLLKMNGRGYMVHRPERLAEILQQAISHRLMPKRIRFIYPKPKREANMVLIEFIKDGKSGGIRIVPPLTISKDNNEYGPEMQAMLYGK